jgi:hypothetical protein
LQYPSFGFSHLQANPEGPGACLSTSSTLEQLVTCFDNYVVSPEYYDLPRYSEAQPKAEERAGWTEAVASLLATDNNCSSITVPNHLADLYSIATFTESSSSSNSYCVLSEITSENGSYSKGWGLMVVPASRRAVSRFIHISAPHPSAEINITQQAAALFKSTGAKSLFIPGRIRMAFLDLTDCVESPPGTPYYKTDPAHDKVNNLSQARAHLLLDFLLIPCPSCSRFMMPTRLFGRGKMRTEDVRLHHAPSSNFMAKGPRPVHLIICSYQAALVGQKISFRSLVHPILLCQTIFAGNSPGSKVWYTNDVDRPIKRLQSQLKLAFPSWNVSLPSGSSCSLTATKNIIGRLLNGIDDSQVCSQGSDARLATGVFVHIEQGAAARAERTYEAWSGALMKAFDAVCDAGMRVGPVTQVCEYV